MVWLQWLVSLGEKEISDRRFWFSVDIDIQLPCPSDTNYFKARHKFMQISEVACRQLTRQLRTWYRHEHRQQESKDFRTQIGHSTAKYSLKIENGYCYYVSWFSRKFYDALIWNYRCKRTEKGADVWYNNTKFSFLSR